jgi:hypothetical protein
MAEDPCYRTHSRGAEKVNKRSFALPHAVGVQTGMLESKGGIFLLGRHAMLLYF